MVKNKSWNRFSINKHDINKMPNSKKNLSAILSYLSAIALIAIISPFANADDVVVDNGKIGIGIASPGEKLEAIGNIKMQNNNEVYLSLRNTEANGRQYALVSAGSSGGIGVGKFSIYDQTADVSRLMIDTAGNVGIGTMNPAEKLDVNGNVQALAYYYASDKRLKTDIRKLDGLKIISRLNGVNFNWIADNSADMGLIAQDVEKALPGLVKTNSEGMKSLKYGSLIAPLIEAVKELDERNINNTMRIRELELQISQLRDELDEIKKQ